MINRQLKELAEEQFEQYKGDGDKRAKWAQVLATCLQTETLELLAQVVENKVMR